MHGQEDFHSRFPLWKYIFDTRSGSENEFDLAQLEFCVMDLPT